MQSRVVADDVAEGDKHHFRGHEDPNWAVAHNVKGLFDFFTQIYPINRRSSGRRPRENAAEFAIAFLNVATPEDIMPGEDGVPGLAHTVLVNL